jgi:hypothetical protein
MNRTINIIFQMLGCWLNQSLTNLRKRLRYKTCSLRASKHCLEIIALERLINKLGVVRSHHRPLIKWISLYTAFPDRVIVSRQLHLKFILQTAAVFWVFTALINFELVLHKFIFVDTRRYLKKIHSSQFLFFFNYLISFYWVHLSFFLVEVYLFVLYHFKKLIF